MEVDQQVQDLKSQKRPKPKSVSEVESDLLVAKQSAAKETDALSIHRINEFQMRKLNKQHPKWILTIRELLNIGTASNSID